MVVGFIGRRPSYSSQLINRVIDSNVFGSGNLDKVLCIENEEVKDWFKRRKISYYFEEQKGILFLQFTSTHCPAIDEKVEPGSGFDSVIGEHEFGDLQGMLFMFSVSFSSRLFLKYKLRLVFFIRKITLGKVPSSLLFFLKL